MKTNDLSIDAADVVSLRNHGTGGIGDLGYVVRRPLFRRSNKGLRVLKTK